MPEKSGEGGERCDGADLYSHPSAVHQPSMAPEVRIHLWAFWYVHISYTDLSGLSGVPTLSSFEPVMARGVLGETVDRCRRTIIAQGPHGMPDSPPDCKEL